MEFKFLYSYINKSLDELFSTPVFKRKVEQYAPAGGGSGSTWGLLEAPNGSLWQIGVNDSGALQTTQVAGGTPTTLTLYAPDGSTWSVTVNNAGALTTTKL